MRKVLLMPTHTIEGAGGGIRVYNERIVDLFRTENNFEVSIYPYLSHKTILGSKYKYNQLKKNIESIRPDIIHINGYTSQIPKQVISVAKKLNAKIIYTAHWHPFETMRLPKFKEIYFNLFIRPYLKHIDTIIAINREEYAFFSKFHSNVQMIPHWIPLDMETNTNNRKIPSRILFVGNPMVGNKGLDYLFKLPKGKYDIHCVGKDNVKLREDMTQHIGITNKELTSLYSSSSLLVVPSRYEAFSYATLEALVNGTPVLVSDKVRIIDQLKGEPGVTVFKAGDYNEFVGKIDYAMTQKVNIEHIKEIFSAEKALIKYKNVYSLGIATEL